MKPVARVRLPRLLLLGMLGWMFLFGTGSPGVRSICAQSADRAVWIRWRIPVAWFADPPTLYKGTIDVPVDDTAVVLGMASRIAAVRLSDATGLWSADLQGELGSPFLNHQDLRIGKVEGEQLGLVAVKATGGSVAWTARFGSFSGRLAGIYGDSLFLVRYERSAGDRLLAIDPETGQIRWTCPVGGRGKIAYFGDIVGELGRLWVAKEHSVYCIAADSGKIERTIPLPFEAQMLVEIDDRMLIAIGSNDAAAISRPSGDILWVVERPSGYCLLLAPTLGFPARILNPQCVSSGAGVLCIEPSGGIESFRLPMPGLAGLVVVGDRLVAMIDPSKIARSGDLSIVAVASGSGVAWSRAVVPTSGMWSQPEMVVRGDDCMVFGILPGDPDSDLDVRLVAVDVGLRSGQISPRMEIGLGSKEIGWVERLSSAILIATGSELICLDAP